MPGSIPAPNSGSFMEKYENIVSQMGQTDKKILKKKKKKRYFVRTCHVHFQCGEFSFIVV